MAAGSNKKPIRKKARSDRRLIVRIIAIIIVALMLLSAASMIIPFLTINSAAAENTDESTVEKSSSIKYYYTQNKNDILIAVGLMYADGVTQGFETSAKNGFSAGYINTDRQYHELFKIDLNKVSVICDSNMQKSGYTYTITTSYTPVVGGWHLETDAGSDYLTEYEYYKTKAENYNVFPAYINGKVVFRFGQYGSKEAAETNIPDLNNLGITVRAVGPAKTALSVINPANDDILFELDGGNSYTLGLTPLQKEESTAYIVTPAQNTYGGVFRYARWQSGDTDGVAVTNIIPLEEYVEGVVPWEIGITWDIEAQKTFAVCARSFALTSRKHVTFDVCNGTCCQVYKGRNRTNESIIEAVRSTAGEVMTYNKKIATAVYSSSTGGTTVSGAEAWGSSRDYAYLSAVVTPWENYSSYPNGEWKTEMSGGLIISKINASGYGLLSGTLISVKIDQYAENSSYVYSITFTDSYGKSVTLTRSDRIRSVLGLNSANFAVALAGQPVILNDYTLDGEAIQTLVERSSAVVTPNTSETILNTGGVFALSAGSPDGAYVPIGESVAMLGIRGIEISLSLSDLVVITGEGQTKYDMVSKEIDPNENQETESIAENNTPLSTNLPDITTTKTNIIKNTREITAQGTNGSFVFYGRGWGHGVGISQYGAKDLADLGYDYKTILKTYFTGISIENRSSIIIG